MCFFDVCLFQIRLFGISLCLVPHFDNCIEILQLSFDFLGYELLGDETYCVVKYNNEENDLKVQFYCLYDRYKSFTVSIK